MDSISRPQRRPRHPRRRAVAVGGKAAGRRGRPEAGGVRRHPGFHRLHRTNGPSEDVEAVVTEPAAAAAAAAAAVAAVAAVAVALAAATVAVAVGGAGDRRRGGGISDLLVALEVLFGAVRG
jgi:hypothetical protein